MRDRLVIRFSFGLLFVGALSLSASACGDADEEVGSDPPARGGAGGKAGSAGKGGAGVAGAAGKAGGGGAIAGQGGASGSASGQGGAAGGTAGQGGVGGATGGSAGQTSGGNAGNGAAGSAGQAAAGSAGKASGGAGGQTSAGAGGQASAGAAGQSSAGAGGQTSAGAGGQPSGGAGGQTADPFTYAYQENGNFVRYLPIPNAFEKIIGGQRDNARKMMPIDLHTWSIANFDVNKRMFSDFRLQDGSGKVLYEIHDLEGAVHGELATNQRDKDRGNNHQQDKSDFLISEGDYTVVYTLLGGSTGRPQLIVWRQRPNNMFAILVGANPSETDGNTIDDKGYLVNFGETVSRTFHVTYFDEDNVLYKSNANGFEKP